MFVDEVRFAFHAKDEAPLTLEKNLTLLWKEQREPREVDLLDVGFLLGKVRVDGEIRGQPRRDAPFRVGADLLSRRSFVELDRSVDATKDVGPELHRASRTDVPLEAMVVLWK